MLGSSRFSLLVVALVAFVSFVTARTVITSQTCATRYCGSLPKKIVKTTKTICKTLPYTKVRWKTVNKPRITRIVTSTKTSTSQRYFTVGETFSTISLATVWLGTTTISRTVHGTITITTATVTSSVFTATITTPTVTVPKPSGFQAIRGDPGNFGVDPRDDDDPEFPWWGRTVRKLRREAQPEPGQGKYVTALTCTKILITKTGTSDLWKTTTKAASTTTKTVLTTKIVLPPVITTTKTTTKVQWITTSKYKVAFFSSIFDKTITSYTAATTYLSTVSTSLPAPTHYLACQYEFDYGNMVPSPEWGGRYHAQDVDPLPGNWTRTVPSNTADDCCGACHGFNEESATCSGSVWKPLTGQPGFAGECVLYLFNQNGGQCPQRAFKFNADAATPERIISNGPSCAMFKWKGFVQDLQ
ncbi:hypothetical protein TWF718_005395 [Orbilia javanica]|uniref:Uncharacterized protein n=1 Tax=Orbilia javanica TaxID=47235 RepID=A0AAN8MYV6_9PEZI